MSKIYAGSTPIFTAKIINELGIQLDPSDANSVSEVKIFIYDSTTGVTIGKFYLNTLPSGTGWTKLPTPKTISAGDVRVLLPLTEAQTKSAEGNSNMIQMNVHIVDPDAPEGRRIEIHKCKFLEILPAQS